MSNQTERNTSTTEAIAQVQEWAAAGDSNKIIRAKMTIAGLEDKVIYAFETKVFVSGLSSCVRISRRSDARVIAV